MTDDKITIETLIAYVAGELDEQTAARVKAHIRSSASDAERVARLRTVIKTMRADDTLAPPNEPLDRAKAIFKPSRSSAWRSLRRQLEAVVASLVYDSRAQPALAGYRGAGDVVQLSYESEIADVDLELSPTGAQAGATWLVMGQISPHEMRARPVVALLSPSDESFCMEIAPDEHGVFTLQSASGEYELVIRFADRVVVFPDVNLN
jgi:hypothetical protein